MRKLAFFGREANPPPSRWKEGRNMVKLSLFYALPEGIIRSTLGLQ